MCFLHTCRTAQQFCCTASKPLLQPTCNASYKACYTIDETELANLLLRMCPDSWQNQYNFSQDTITTTVPQKPSANGNENGKSNGKESNGKRKGRSVVQEEMNG